MLMRFGHTGASAMTNHRPVILLRNGFKGSHGMPLGLVGVGIPGGVTTIASAVAAATRRDNGVCVTTSIPGADWAPQTTSLLSAPSSLIRWATDSSVAPV